MKKLIILSALASLSLTACTATPRSSGDVYRSSEVNRVMQGQSCTVQSARYVSVVGDGYEDRQQNTLTSGVGAVTGALLGNALGNEIGGGNGRDLARGLGTIGGAVAGAAVAGNINAKRTTRQGVQYEVSTGGRTQVVIQELNAGESAMPAGSSCILARGAGGARVLPR